ncbi:hypothetical protein [Desulfuribacillus stibiiarsenatis]|nr:hypothetical protein [Desulfuribacillus stibiiarsenatis]
MDTNRKDIMETLQEQFELLAERSKNCSEDVLPSLSGVMLAIYVELNKP